MHIEDNRFRTILGITLLAAGAVWIAHSALHNGKNNHNSIDSANAETRGDGNIVSTTRPIDDVKAIDLDGCYETVIHVGGAPHLSITAEDNILPLVTTDIDDGVLEVSSEDFRTDHTPKLEITVPSLESLKFEVSTVKITGLDSDRFELHIDGAGAVTASGRTGNADIKVDGAAHLDLTGLVVGNMKLRIEGAGHAEVTAKESLDARIEGAGYVGYHGDPKSVKKEIEGFGTIEQAS